MMWHLQQVLHLRSPSSVPFALLGYERRRKGHVIDVIQCWALSDVTVSHAHPASLWTASLAVITPSVPRLEDESRLIRWLFGLTLRIPADWLITQTVICRLSMAQQEALWRLWMLKLKLNIILNYSVSQKCLRMQPLHPEGQPIEIKTMSNSSNDCVDCKVKPKYHH